MTNHKTLLKIFVLSLALTAGLLAAPQAQAEDYGLPDISQDGWYSALSQYVSFLDGRAGQPANATQRQNFRSQLVSLTNNAAADMQGRSNQRVSVGYGQNRAELAATIGQLQADFNAYKADAISTYQDNVGSAQGDYSDQLKDAKANLQDTLDNIQQSLSDALASFQGQGSGQPNTTPSRACIVARRLANKAKKRFGKKSKKTTKARLKAGRLCANTGNNYDYSDANGIADAKQQAQQDIASAQSDFNATKADLDDTLKGNIADATSQRDDSIQQATDQYNSQAADATSNADGNWANEFSYISSVYIDEIGQVSSLYSQGDSDISNYPH